MRSGPNQRRVLLPLTAALTFFAGVFMAHGRMDLFWGILAVIVIAWLAVAVKILKRTT
jgi:hypothetical protein